MMLLFWILAVVFGGASWAAADPAISGHSGSAAHGGALTLSGSGFGTKSTVAPVIWDNCDHPTGDPAEIALAGWSGAWPSAGTTANQMQYITSGTRSFNAPHSRTNKYMRGSHAESVGASQGYNVMVYKNFTPTFPQKFYFSWRHAFDPSFNPAGADENHKLFDLSQGTSPYTDPNYWYVGYNPGLSSSTTGMYTSRNFGRQFWDDNSLTRSMGTWVQFEMVGTIDSTTGAITLLDLGVGTTAHLTFTGQNTTVTATGQTNTISAGGFGRPYGVADNFRYFADLYFDTSWARVILTNASTLAGSTVREVQYPTAWADGSITVTVNRGVLPDSGAIYAYIYNNDGTVNAVGYDVSGGGGGSSNPRFPTSFLRRASYAVEP